MIQVCLMLNLPPPKSKHIKHILQDLDVNKDGKITLDEFRPLVLRLLMSEGYLHISKRDLKKIKLLDFEPYCKELHESVTKVITDNSIKSICEENKLVWFI